MSTRLFYISTNEVIVIIWTLIGYYLKAYIFIIIIQWFNFTTSNTGTIFAIFSHNFLTHLSHVRSFSTCRNICHWNISKNTRNSNPGVHLSFSVYYYINQFRFTIWNIFTTTIPPLNFCINFCFIFVRSSGDWSWIYFPFVYLIEWVFYHFTKHFFIYFRCRSR